MNVQPRGGGWHGDVLTNFTGPEVQPCTTTVSISNILVVASLCASVPIKHTTARQQLEPQARTPAVADEAPCLALTICCLRATAEDSCQAARAFFSFSVHRRRPSHLVSPAARLLRCDRPSQT